MRGGEYDLRSGEIWESHRGETYFNVWSMILEFESMFGKVGSMIVGCWSMLFFVRGGWLFTDAQQLYGAGYEGAYWSSRAWSGASNAYYLNFDYRNVTLSNAPNRYRGYLLRCLIPTP